jgi:hypothetical protein
MGGTDPVEQLLCPLDDQTCRVFIAADPKPKIPNLGRSDGS